MMMPRGRLLVDDEIGADGEHAGLQHHAQHRGNRPKPPATSLALLLAATVLAVGLAPAAGRCGRYAHRDQRPRRCAGWLRPIPLRDAAWLVAASRGLARGQAIGEDGQDDEDDRAAERGDADQK